MRAELKPCPFCGDESPQDDGEYIICDCGQWDAHSHRTAWNCRPVEDRLTTELTRLKATVEELEVVNKILTGDAPNTLGLQEHARAAQLRVKEIREGKV